MQNKCQVPAKQLTLFLQARGELSTQLTGISAITGFLHFLPCGITRYAYFYGIGLLTTSKIKTPPYDNT
jgi:hypothetical protein